MGKVTQLMRDLSIMAIEPHELLEAKLLQASKKN